MTRHSTLLALCLAACPGICGVPQAVAEEKVPLIPRHVLFGNPDKAGLQLSPDGKHISYLAPVNGVLILYGNERCPTNNDGAEIVVCERRSAQEQFRVPKELREFQVTPQNQSWAARAQGVLDTGVSVSSTGSCSVVGASGQSGCFAQAARAARAERQQQKAEEARIP